MEDPILNRNFEETKELQARWSQFHDFVLMAIQQGPAKVTTQAEMKFLELKSRIAMLHDSFMSGLKHEQKIGQNIMLIVSNTILLKRVASFNDAEKQKFEFDWNECFLLMTEQVGALEEEKKRLAGINESKYRAAQRAELFKAQFHNFMHSIYLKLAIGAVVLFMVLYGVPAFGLYNYKEFGKMSWSRPGYVWVVNNIYRPYMDPEIEYQSMEQNIPAEVHPETVNGIKQLGNEQLGMDNFKNFVLGSIGFAPDGLAEAKQLVDGNLGYETEHFQADQKDVFLFYIMFATPKDAQRFTELEREGLAKLQPAAKDQLLNKTYVLRRANFVAIGISEHGMRESQLREKWKFDGEKFKNELTK